ncbi:unnamed protein product [Cuscuta campestris]|uniref:Uncharacterized protein n=1 Tax=Cuscuta campestris TaxID=132261 RepID=A0A484ND37_9ASTE|nr:unnamed protein product [Cuscuta campestris]
MGAVVIVISRRIRLFGLVNWAQSCFVTFGEIPGADELSIAARNVEILTGFVLSLPPTRNRAKARVVEAQNPPIAGKTTMDGNPLDGIFSTAS